jgi:hypothetical protein
MPNERAPTRKTRPAVASKPRAKAAARSAPVEKRKPAVKKPAAKEAPKARWKTLFDDFWAGGGTPGASWAKLPAKQRMAVAVGLFHGQMLRNGSQLWITNGYSPGCSKEALAQLKKLGSATAREVATIVNDTLEIQKLAWKREEELSETSSGEDQDDDPVLDALAERCSGLDERYRALGTTLMAEVEAWVQAR